MKFFQGLVPFLLRCKTLGQTLLSIPWVRGVFFFLFSFGLIGAAVSLYLGPYPPHRPEPPPSPSSGIPSELLRLGQIQLRNLGPAGSYDAFGLPVTGPFETASPGGDPEAKEDLADVAKSLPIQGYWEGREVIIAGKLYRPGDNLLIRTPRNVYRVTVSRILPEGLELVQEEGDPIRVLWPPLRSAGSPQGSEGITVYFDRGGNK
jgi:hypothetical protein